MNSKLFVHSEFSDTRILKRMSGKLYPLSSDARIDYVNTIKRTSMKFNDRLFNFVGLTTEHEHGFYLEQNANRGLSYKNRWQNALTLELDLDNIEYHRQVYTILDYFSDVGGLFGAVSPIFMTLLAVFNFYSSY